MTKKIINAPLRIWVEYHTTETGGEATSPGEQWSNHEDIEITADFIRLHRQQPNFWSESIEINNADLLKLNTLWLAVVAVLQYNDQAVRDAEQGLIG